MANNTYKSPKRPSIFAHLEPIIASSNLFVDGLPVRYIPLVLYVLLLGLCYVGNTHYHERMVRETHRITQEVSLLRVDFTELKAKHMLDSKQSVVAKRVASLGIYETNRPPLKVKLNQ